MNKRDGGRTAAAVRNRLGLFAKIVLGAGTLVGLLGGVPWMLVRFVGNPNPWPGGWGSASQAKDRLSEPITDEVLISLLAILGWICWTAFVVDLLLELAWYVRQFPSLIHRADAQIVYAAHVRELPTYRAGAAILVGGLVLTLLATWRTTAAVASTAVSSSIPGPRSAVSMAPLEIDPASDPSGRFPSSPLADAQVSRPAVGSYAEYTVRRGDTLWGIAKARLGDPLRWPEIYRLSKALEQQDGARLTDPDAIKPGWTLRLPASDLGPVPEPPTETVAPAPPVQESPGIDPPTPSPVNPAETPSTSPKPHQEAPVQDSAPSSRDKGVELPDGAYVGVGLAAAVTAVALVVRLRRRRQYEPGSGRRDDLTMAPIVRAMRHAYDGLTEPDGEDVLVPTGRHHQQVADHTRRSRAEAVAARSMGAGGLVVGVRDGRAKALDFARAQGLGLTGAGGPAAARALLVTLLMMPSDQDRPGATLIVPEADAQRLLGSVATDQPRPGRLRLVADLAAALDLIEAELLARVRGPATTRGLDADSQLVLVASPTPKDMRRLESILTTRSRVRVTGLLLGQWRLEQTVRVERDGVVSSVGRRVEDLSGTRLFSLPTEGAQALVALLAEAEGRSAPRSPRPRRRRDEDSDGDGSERGHEGALSNGPTQPTGQAHGDSVRVANPPHRSEGPQHEVPAGDSDEHPNARMTEAERPDHPDPRPSQSVSIALSVLGPFDLLYRLNDEQVDLTSSFAPKQREILVYLALHRRGVRAETIATDIWPSAPAERPANSFHATLSQFRRALRNATAETLTDITVHSNGRYVLDERATNVDLWQVQDSLQAVRKAADGPSRRAAAERLIELYRGDLGMEMTSEWLEAPREQLRRDVLDAITGGAQAVRDADPESALTLLEHARSLDPYTEQLYVAIARLQAQLGRPDAIRRTVALLAIKLAEIDDEPSLESIRLCEQLQRSHPADIPAVDNNCSKA